jgi:hypothetical protein
MYAGAPPGDPELLTLARAARDAAPDAETARHWGRILDVITAGRAVRVASFPAVFAVGEDLGHAELVAAVEEIFTEGAEQ